MLGIFTKFFNFKYKNKVKKLYKCLDEINSYESRVSNFTDKELKQQTQILKDKIATEIHVSQATLCLAFAVVREATKRTLNIRHFDVQILGGVSLYNGCVAEMATGEGKTLAATTATYLRALEGKGVHIVTVNDYLAERDANDMKPIFEFLGLSVGCITAEKDDKERKRAYMCDITYATNNELGFDYLRDNTKFSQEDKVQRELHAACIDEADSILIDEARTPLVLSGSVDENLDLWNIIDSLISQLDSCLFSKDEKMSSVALTEEGVLHLEKKLQHLSILPTKANLYDPEHSHLVYQINQSLRAHTLFQKDVDYIVRDNKVLCLNKNTGRISEGKRYASGLHQALEAKEKVKILPENEELASITFQNYFRLYNHISGMTGTAATEAEEFKTVYKLDVITIPTNKPLKRIDHSDSIYATEQAKYKAVCALIKERYEIGQPMLIGTEDIQQSELLSKILQKEKIKHNVLNAKNHAMEAKIIAQAGCFKSVTISTNMAGRGTDIKLGGNVNEEIRQFVSHNSDIDEEKLKLKIQEIEAHHKYQKEKVQQAGGLLVIGTVRHESRRIDNQLRGRSGRQGDVGQSKFFLSLDDKLIRIFASEKSINFLKKQLSKEADQVIDHNMASYAIKTAQKRMENQHYEMRQHLLKFDDVINKQRTIIYEQRNKIMENNVLAIDTLAGIVQDALFGLLSTKITSTFLSEEDKNIAQITLETICGIKDSDALLKGCQNAKDIAEKAANKVCEIHKTREELYDAATLKAMVTYLRLSTLDNVWKEHLANLSVVKEAIQNRAYAQKDPLSEYKAEAFESFTKMIDKFNILFIQKLSFLEKMTQAQDTKQKEEQLTNNSTRRNQKCHCNSGKKYKHCHGKDILTA
ncbi:preprotein translocase subunit SecA [Candidatus Sneabacter namystus]|uniref:Protein translocase subunit SecA n=1 Tax=Candidatus Sneabacter namystus TaxID=2601646 RepID=A0A5C0UJV3_9RICK|nr:preprotein translocase subunit SecA [Candidatus Sneabacter namystus]QEK39823.1 preprotein translocase subunit SecA [Candidatus Sneabacter namystus]